VVSDAQETRPARIAQAVIIAVLGAGVWAFVVVSGVMSRTFDGGIFLSTVGGIRRGLPLYSGVWDNKDPLFYGTMTAFSSVAPVLAFVMDWFWIALAAVGVVLLARRVVSISTAVLLGVVVTPFLILGPAYEPGLTNTPGTAVALLCLGLLINRWWLWAGVTMGLLLFVKILAFPVVVLCALVLVAFPSLRRGLIKVGLGLVAAVLGGVALMAVLGWLPGYLTMLQRNREYAGEIMVFFSLDDSPVGHLAKFVEEWRASQWIAGIALLGILAASVVWLIARRGRFTTENRLTVAWLGAWLCIIVAAVAVSGWTSPNSLAESYVARFQAFPAAMDAVDATAPEATLLNTVPATTFTFARLGTNDDPGFLGQVKDGAELACPEFHAYGFSPAETFTELYDCLDTVDVVVKSASFDALNNGAVAPVVRPILDKVRINFDCLDVDARQLCIRKGF
jgi:hypothetical protein